ncbi:biotin synthase BioB [Endomicrobium proavitum]|uniref:biotin synthase BioB n=1 Tax=Endomicrobium proavitum TaxID=1408281 RepID=UPI000ABA6447|nr:biotin synthase BioB [Endomicrobium proavitum]
MEKLILDTVAGKQISQEEALSLFDFDIEDLFFAATKIRKKFKGNKVKICSIINAKSGQCSEDCKFCAQSVHHKTAVNVYPLVSNEKIEEVSNKALENAGCFGIVSSGNNLTDEEIDRLCEVLKKHKKSDHFGASIGHLSDVSLKKLKAAGLKKLHHNLETSESYFKNICTTHTYAQRKDTIIRAKALGYEICSGGLFGIGEKLKDRVELAFTLKELGVNSVPMNFLMPVKGTAFEGAKPISPTEILKTIAVFRMVLQTPDIMICGGREINLRDLQSMIFFAGASGTMSGGYLTTWGRDAAADKQMIKDLDLEIDPHR